MEVLEDVLEDVVVLLEDCVELETNVLVEIKEVEFNATEEVTETRVEEVVLKTTELEVVNTTAITVGDSMATLEVVAIVVVVVVGSAITGSGTTIGSSEGAGATETSSDGQIVTGAGGVGSGLSEPHLGIASHRPLKLPEGEAAQLSIYCWQMRWGIVSW